MVTEAGRRQVARGASKLASLSECPGTGPVLGPAIGAGLVPRPEPISGLRPCIGMNLI